MDNRRCSWEAVGLEAGEVVGFQMLVLVTGEAVGHEAGEVVRFEVVGFDMVGQ